MDNWRKEFQYLLNRKILSKDELTYLFGQIKSIIENENKAILRRAEAAESDWQLAEERIKELEDALTRIDTWAKAYPLDIFPKPDLKQVAKVLKAAGMTLDAISADAMRHVLDGVKDITEQAIKEDK